MASGIYNRLKANLMNKVVDLEADTIKIALMDTNHSFTATHNNWSEVSANEIADDSGNGYTAGGETLANLAVTQAATTKWDNTVDIAWSSATFTAYHAVIYDTTASNDLICSLDFSGAKTVSSGTFTIQFDAAGIITLT